MTRSRSGGVFRPDAARLTQVLGELEAEVMKVLWGRGKPLPVREVRGRLAAAGRMLAYNTVMTVLVRLVEKGLLTREKREGIWHYEPTLGEDEFGALVSGQVLRGLLDAAPAATLARLVDVLAEDEPAALDELARLIEARRGRSGGEEGP